MYAWQIVISSISLKGLGYRVIAFTLLLCITCIKINYLISHASIVTNRIPACALCINKRFCLFRCSLVNCNRCMIYFFFIQYSTPCLHCDKDEANMHKMSTFFCDISYGIHGIHIAQCLVWTPKAVILFVIQTQLTPPLTGIDGIGKILQQLNCNF